MVAAVAAHSVVEVAAACRDRAAGTVRQPHGPRVTAVAITVVADVAGVSRIRIDFFPQGLGPMEVGSGLFFSLSIMRHNNRYRYVTRCGEVPQRKDRQLHQENAQEPVTMKFRIVALAMLPVGLAAQVNSADERKYLSIPTMTYARPISVSALNIERELGSTSIIHLSGGVVIRTPVCVSVGPEKQAALFRLCRSAR